jgi:hypothetical protein
MRWKSSSGDRHDNMATIDAAAPTDAVVDACQESLANARDRGAEQFGRYAAITLC